MINIAEVNQSPFILGGAAFSGEGGGYGFGSIENKDIENIIRHAIDHEVSTIDLAPIYGFSHAEKSVGRITSAFRDKVFLASKSGVSWHSTKRVNMTNDPKVTKSMLEQSLRDLNTDYIDCYFIHWPDKNVDIRRPMEVLQRKKELGQIRYIGLCNTTIEDLKLASEISEISIIQSEYNLFRSGMDEKLGGLLVEKNIPVWGWGTFDKGIISGSVTKDRLFEQNDCRSWAPWWKKSNKNQKIEKMNKVFSSLQNEEKIGVTLALAHAKKSAFNLTPIIGTRSIEQLDNVLHHLTLVPDFTSQYESIMEKYFND